MPIFMNLRHRTFRSIGTSTVKMDPVSITTGVLSSFQIVYLTTRFIYNEVMKAKGFRGGKAQMAMKYRLEIVRLKTFWVVLTKSTGTTINTKSLNSLSRVSSGVLAPSTSGIKKGKEEEKERNNLRYKSWRRW
jgi:hypothetical protein